MSGISQPNNYYKTRKALEKKGLIQTDEKGNLYINTQKILSKAQEESSASQAQSEAQNERSEWGEAKDERARVS